MEKKDEIKRPDVKKGNQVNDNIPFSSTIKNAHASGDGALERGSESIDQIKKDESFSEERNPYQNYFMEILFTATLSANGAYQVSFHDDAYHFEPEDAAKTHFAIKRENDEWKASESIDKNLFAQAVTELDKYLLSQH